MTRTIYHIVKNARGQYYSMVDGRPYFTGVKQHAYAFSSAEEAASVAESAKGIDSTAIATTGVFTFPF